MLAGLQRVAYGNFGTGETVDRNIYELEFHAGIGWRYHFLREPYLEHTWNDVTRQVSYPLKIAELYKAIAKMGATSNIMSTEDGQWLKPPVAHQMGLYIKEMLEHGMFDKTFER